jgi:hypothetical protein
MASTLSLNFLFFLKLLFYWTTKIKRGQLKSANRKNMFNDDEDYDEQGDDPGFGYFMSPDHEVLNDDEQLAAEGEDVPDFDDEKNDLTFGDDIGGIGLQNPCRFFISDFFNLLKSGSMAGIIFTH